MSLRPAHGLKAALGAAGLALALIVAAPASAATYPGTVTNASTSTPLQGICVGVYAGTAADSLTPPQPLATAQTAADVTYTVNTGIAVSFKIGFSDCSNQGYATQFADSSPDLDGARTISGFGTTTVNAALTQGAAMSGTVYAGDGTTPLQGACVSLLNGNGGAVATPSTA